MLNSICHLMINQSLCINYDLLPVIPAGLQRESSVFKRFWIPGSSPRMTTSYFIHRLYIALPTLLYLCHCQERTDEAISAAKPVLLEEKNGVRKSLQKKPLDCDKIKLIRSCSKKFCELLLNVERENVQNFQCYDTKT